MMKRLLRWTFDLLAALSAAMLIHIVVVLALYALANPVGWDFLVRNPGPLLPVFAYSILPIAWIITTVIRHSKQRPRPGFEVTPVSPDDAHANETR